MSRGPKDTPMALLGTLLVLAVILLYLPGALMFLEEKLLHSTSLRHWLYDQALLSALEELYKHTLPWFH